MNSVTRVTITSAANSSLHHPQSLNSQTKNNHLLEASFSSYLNSNEGNFGRKLADSSKNLNPFSSNREDDLLHHMGKKKEEDEEIGVFSAEKYFNGGIEDSPRVSSMPARKPNPHPHQKNKQETAPEETRKSKVPSRGTPSVRSESSWNSRSALLKSAVKNSSRGSKKKAQGKSFLANLACKCSCSDKDSVDINSNASGEISFSKNDSFGVVPEKTMTPQKAFKTVNFGLENQLVKVQLEQDDEAEKARKSLEVFGSPILENRSKSMSFDKRLAVPPSSSSRDHHIAVSAPKMEEETDFSGGNYINDAASDASSDLFEIESLTGRKSNPYLTRQASDAANSGCVTPTTCYAPSEASIEWSVVTASAAEYSVLSDCDEQRSVATVRSPIRSSFASTNGKSKANTDMQRRRSGSILGCKSHKAVRVAGDAFMRYEKPSSNTPRPQMTKGGSFDSRHAQHTYASKPMQRSHSPHASQLLHI